jgi:hypothetical protein
VSNVEKIIDQCNIFIDIKMNPLKSAHILCLILFKEIMSAHIFDIKNTLAMLD